MKKRMLMLSGFVVLVLVCGLIIYGQKVNNKKYYSYISASWMMGYGDVESLTKDSDLIGLIQVDGVDESIGGSIPATVYRAEVIDGILGCKKEDEIQVYMTGGEKDGVVYEVETDPLMKQGQEFLIFAQHNEDGTYTVLGGPQGRMLYENGKLNSLKNTSLPHVRVSTERTSEDTQNEDYLINIKDESLDNIKKQIEGAIQ